LVISIIGSSLLKTSVSNLLIFNERILFMLIGGSVVFSIGLIDDFRRCSPWIKLLFQIIGASIAFYGNLRIEGIGIFDISIKLGMLSYFVTVFWFVLFINAVNIVDGLDGLAGGIAVFASLIMVILFILADDFLTAIFFSALAGSVLGFLRYNFNPASIFLGDGGSYLLGYSIAAFSIIGNVKSQIGVALMMPLLALGIPLFDTLLSPMRRFILGKKIFSPDAKHFHHKLLDMGLTTRKAVWLIYMITFFLSVTALVMVNVRDERAGLFLIVLGAGAFVLVRKLGYFEHIGSGEIYGWLKDITDVTGLTHARRSFLSLQFDINNSKTIEEMWQNIVRTLEIMEFDIGAFYLNTIKKKEAKKKKIERRIITPSQASVALRKDPPKWRWLSPSFSNEREIDSRSILRIELPLIAENNINYGVIVLMKDLSIKSLNYYTLSRVEHLRRTTIRTLETMNDTTQ
jgi:UDP-GlcNAc:undecaprenyl-phosphate GlcNAc-1-phosphate transferase